jgi:hypothetical protein
VSSIWRRTLAGGAADKGFLKNETHVRRENHFPHREHVAVNEATKPAAPRKPRLSALGREMRRRRIFGRCARAGATRIAQTEGVTE